MSHVPHELHDEFPEYEQKLHDLKMSNAHFAKLSDEYHDVNREIHRIEAEIEPTSDVYLEDQKKKRLMLLDEISTILHA
ncbi:MAG: DUF465 domain-containing protein [Cohaesibacter sp.]|jgi:uncharacterized protein YdcH (DUF465 family)|nr:DUF465 domain-containing protein [Cohaesibacter sp.]